VQFFEARVAVIGVVLREHENEFALEAYRNAMKKPVAFPTVEAAINDYRRRRIEFGINNDTRR
jgi:hypothetical protein